MNRVLYLVLRSLGLAVVGTWLCVVSLPADAHAIQPPVRWASRIDATIKPGETQTIPVTLTASYDLPALTVFVGEKLRPFVSISNPTVPALKRGQTATISFNISAPIEALQSSTDGFVVLLAKLPTKQLIRIPLLKPLAIGVDVVCPCVPPDPGVAGMATIEGVDSDNDGIRDDAQRYIAITFPASARIRSAATQLARALQYSLTSDLSNQQAAASLRAQLDASYCAAYVDSNNTSGLVESIQVLMLNTAERRAQYDQLLLPFAGTILEPSSESPAAEACQFELASLPN